MKTARPQNLMAAALGGVMAFTTTIVYAADGLPSWNDTAPKQAIVQFVEKVTKEGSPDFVPVHAEREFAYDRESHIGKLDKGHDEAAAREWTVVSMKDDWKQIFAFQQ